MTEDQKPTIVITPPQKDYYNITKPTKTERGKGRRQRGESKCQNIV